VGSRRHGAREGDMSEKRIGQPDAVATLVPRLKGAGRWFACLVDRHPQYR
jgi:hypothetical protein